LTGILVYLYRLERGTRELQRFADGEGKGRRMRIPNVPVVDRERGVLYVSDSHSQSEPRPGIWRVDLRTVEANLWYDKPLRFANGLALTASGDALYVEETFARTIGRIGLIQRVREGSDSRDAGGNSARRPDFRPSGAYTNDSETNS
jgi:sugar lactone lactonase YvrE